MSISRGSECVEAAPDSGSATGASSRRVCEPGVSCSPEKVSNFSMSSRACLCTSIFRSDMFGLSANDRPLIRLDTSSDRYTAMGRRTPWNSSLELFLDFEPSPIFARTSFAYRASIANKRRRSKQPGRYI